MLNFIKFAIPANLIFCLLFLFEWNLNRVSFHFNSNFSPLSSHNIEMFQNNFSEYLKIRAHISALIEPSNYFIASKINVNKYLCLRGKWKEE